MPTMWMVEQRSAQRAWRASAAVAVTRAHVVRPRGLEPLSPAPEAGALSIELWARDPAFAVDY